MTMRRVRALCVMFIVSMTSSSALAHPMGNFSVSHNTSFDIERGWIKVALRIDIAEIPSVEEMKQLDANHDGELSADEKKAYMAKSDPGTLRTQTIRLNGHPVTPKILRLDVIKSEGAGGMPTLLLVADYRIDFDPAVTSNTLEYQDQSFEGRTGWREITARAGPGMRIVQSDVPEKDLSKGLTLYPDEQIANPPQVRSARIVFGPGVATTQSTTGSGQLAQATPRQRKEDPLAALLGNGRTSTWVVFLSIPIALTLGAFHALSPGHGKTVVAAYLVGSRGTIWHALLLGVVVTLTHTAGVFALGFIVLFASGTIIPEQLYPWLGFVSGAMIFCVGGWQFTRRLAAQYSTTTQQDPHGPGGHSHAVPEKMSLTALIALGVSGGIVPCPSALIVMLSAIAVRRTGAGIILIVAFSLGLAAVLILIGLATVLSAKWLSRWSWEARYTDRLRLASSLAVTILGIVIALQSLRA